MISNLSLILLAFCIADFYTQLHETVFKTKNGPAAHTIDSQAISQTIFSMVRFKRQWLKTDENQI